MTKRELKKVLKKLPNWSVNAKETQLQQTFTFATHVAALVFIARITVHAEVLQHHPDITFTHQKVKVKLTTHSEKTLTKKDFLLASRIDGLATD